MTKKFELTELNIENKHYSAFLKAAQSKIISTRISIAKAACKAQIELYWWFGEQIVKAQEQHGWGKSVVEQLSLDLKRGLKGVTAGFSARNLWFMRSFYLEYKDYPNLQQVVAEIPWGAKSSHIGAS